MGSDCCKTSSDPENDANMLTKEPVNELTKPTIIDTPNQKDIAKTVKTESQKYEPFQFKINNDDYFSIEGMSQKNPQKIMFSTTK